MAITFGEGGTSNNGRIIQVVNTYDNVRRKWTNVTEGQFANTYSTIDTAITPKLATSKLMFFVNVNYGIGDGTGGSCFWKITDDSSGTAHTGLNGAATGGFQCFHEYRW